VRVTDAAAVMAAEELAAATAQANAELTGRGRVLVRPSGTEPLVRVMVEAPSEQEADEVCEQLVALVQAELG
jgi:phosphoglucosamine mutase